MTMLLVIEAIDRGELSLDDTVTVSAHASSMGGSQIFLKEGEKMSVSDMLKSVAVSSANDAAVALGEHLAGSEESFVSLMNARAEELEMNDTNFVNCCGLQADGHLTSAADIAKMSVELLKHKKITEFTTIWTDTVRDGQFGLANTNKMLRTFDGLTGLKTGFTSQAKYCLSASAKRDGVGFVAVLLGCPTSAERFADAAKMLNYGFANYISLAIRPDRPVPAVPVELGDSEYVHGTVRDCRYALVEKTRQKDVVFQMSMEREIKAPVAEGQKIGSVRLLLDGKTLGQSDIVAAQQINRVGMGRIFSRVLGMTFMRDAA